MLKKYKLYKSGKRLVTGVFVAGVIALTGGSQVQADTTTQNSTNQVVQPATTPSVSATTVPV